jgi:hypothetical protein
VSSLSVGVGRRKLIQKPANVESSGEHWRHDPDKSGTFEINSGFLDVREEAERWKMQINGSEEQGNGSHICSPVPADHSLPVLIRATGQWVEEDVNGKSRPETDARADGAGHGSFTALKNLKKGGPLGCKLILRRPVEKVEVRRESISDLNCSFTAEDSEDSEDQIVVGNIQGLERRKGGVEGLTSALARTRIKD